MPVVEVHLIKGYGEAEKARLGRALTGAVTSVVPAVPDGITVLMHEVEPSGYMRGGEGRAPAPALPDPVETVRAFLAAMEARDLDAAQGHLAEGFEMTFPGGNRFTRLADLVAWSGPRYRKVCKTFEGFDVAPGPGHTAVICRGTLSGEWPDGTAFEGIRFTDRFTLVKGRIATQEVWNDMAEARANG